MLAFIDGENFLVRNIGFGGMSVTALGGDLTVGDPVAITIKLDTGKRLAIVGEVARYDGLIQYGITFSGLTPESFAAIEALQTHAGRRPSPTL
ncbi:MAG: PilZ domain-containing protein [Alphaproteobacteria bacterium]|nr:PilZ domain-containing protein [Alphaproteobacteria bacterium]